MSIKAYYRFNGNANDASGNGYNLSFRGTPEYVADGIYNSLSLGSANTNKAAYINNNMGVYNGSQTIFTRLKLLATPAAYKLVIQKSWDGGNPGTTNQWLARIIFYSSTSLRAQVIGNPLAEASYTGTFSLNVWHTFALTFTGTVLILYFNGIEVARNNSANSNIGANNTNLFCLGAQGDQGYSYPNYYWLSGVYDETVVLNSVLSAAQIKNLDLQLKGFF